MDFHIGIRKGLSDPKFYTIQNEGKVQEAAHEHSVTEK